MVVHCSTHSRNTCRRTADKEMQGIAARRIASSSVDDSGKKFVDVSFNAGPLGLNVVWHDKARAVVVQGFRRIDGEWRAS